MRFDLLFFVLVPVISYTTRDCWDRYPEEWGYFRNMYTLMYNTNNGLQDMMNCMEWIYIKSWNIEDGWHCCRHTDVCKLCADYSECLKGKGELYNEIDANNLTIYKKCRLICQQVMKLNIGPENQDDWTRGIASSPAVRYGDQIRKHICSPDYLYVKHVDNKGRGVFTKVDIPVNSYVVYYNGRWSERDPRSDNMYTFEIVFTGTSVWIDADEEDGSYGRLMNDNHKNPNLIAKHVRVDLEDHVAFFASRDIKAGEELTFDYGGDESLYYWRREDVENDVKQDVCNDRRWFKLTSPDISKICLTED